MDRVELTVNGRRRRIEVRGGESLLDVLREQCGVRAAKNGCQPLGQCGACLALVDGRPRTTCTLPASKASGRDVVTLEGVDDAERSLYARAFVAAAGVQCGFCTPGIVLRTKALLDRNPTPSRDEIARALDLHLCRCTGYLRIFEAVEACARARRGHAGRAPGVDGRIGQPLANVQGEVLALGSRAFVDDLHFDGMLHGAVRLSDHARARVLRIDTTRAEGMPGVHSVLTAADVQGHRYYGLLCDDWPGLVAVGEQVRCVGDILAVVAADDPRLARQAAAEVEVDYEVLEPVVDPHEALRDDTPQVHPGRPNALARTHFVRGDAEAALAASAHVARGRWTTQRIEHLFLEPESAVVVPSDDGLRLYTQGQGVFDDRRQVAAFLGIPEEDLAVELVPSGGAFGGKEDLSIQPHAALLAQHAGRPVKLTLTREQSIRVHPKRHPITLDYAVGCDDAGRLTAVQVRMVGDTGAYASVGAKVLERAAGHACGPYRVEHIDVESVAVYTNNPPSGAMRGFGANQAAFALEGCLDELACALGLDQWELRWRNAVAPGDRFATGQRLEHSVGIRRTLEAVRPAWEAASAAGRARGIACGVKNSGIGNGAPEWGRVRLVVESPTRVVIYNGFSEMGQGLFTVLVQCAAEVTRLPAAMFSARVDDRFPLQCGQTTGSRATLLAGRAAIVAAEALARALPDDGGGLEPLVGSVYEGEVLIDDTTAPGDPGPDPKTHTAFGWATQVCVLDDDGRVDRVVAAHDVGRAINPDLCRAQIEGAVHMGLGHALTEELPCRSGMPVAFSPRELGVLRARDMPEVEVHIIEDPEPEGPFGAKGVGEAGLVPTAAAVAGALAAFDGIRRRTLPMKDSPAARAISVGRIRAKDRENWH